MEDLQGKNNASLTTWAIVPGGAVAGKQLILLLNSNSSVSISQRVIGADRPHLFPQSAWNCAIEVAEGSMLEQSLQVIGLGHFDVQRPNVQDTVGEKADLVLTDGHVGYSEEQELVVSNHRVLIEYTLSSTRVQEGKLERIIVGEEQEDAVFGLINRQRFGDKAPPRIVEIITKSDATAAASYVTAKFSASKEQSNVLSVALESGGHIPLIRHCDLTPSSDVHELLCVMWAKFGFTIFETKEFWVDLSAQQKAFKEAYESNQLRLALEYMQAYHKVVKYGPNYDILAIDAVPEGHAELHISDSALLLSRFRDPLRKMLLEDFRTDKAVFIYVHCSGKLEQSDDGKTWTTGLPGVSSLPSFECCHLSLNGSKPLEQALRKQMIRLDVDRAQVAKSIEDTPFIEGDVIRGVVTGGENVIAASETEILVSPKQPGMMAVILVESGAENTKGQLRTYGCYISSDTENKLLAGIGRKMLKQDLPITISVNQRNWPRIISATDGKERSWAFLVLDSGVPQDDMMKIFSS